MSDAKYTPGPWVFQPEHGEMPVVAGAWPLGSSICIVEKEPRVGNSEANAHLIASAPDLLEALTETTRAFEQALDFIEDARDQMPESRELIRRSLAAIAKATP